MLVQKTITARLYATLDSLIDTINRLAGYIKLADLQITAVDFGLTHLRKGITSRDSEGAMNSLRTVLTNINKNKNILAEQGLNDELIARFASALELIANDKQLQYEIGSTRKNIVQDNLALLNGLYQQLIEILIVGKILYKATNPAKLQEYTFDELKKRVRRTTNPVDESASETSKTENAPAI